MKNKTHSQHDPNHRYWAFNADFRRNVCTTCLYDYVWALYLNFYDTV